MILRPLPWTFKHLINPVTARVLRSQAGGKLGEVLLLLSYTGRKSGRKITTPASYTREGDTINLFADGAWGSNFILPAPVEVYIQGKWLAGTAQTFSDPDVIAAAIRRELETHGKMAARRHRRGAEIGRRLVRIVLN